MGMDAVTSAAPVMPERGTAVAKKNTQSADPTAGGKSNKKNILVNNSAASERMGARYRTSVNFPAGTEPAAGPTMANARVVSSIMGKQAPNFNDGMGSSY